MGEAGPVGSMEEGGGRALLGTQSSLSPGVPGDELGGPGQRVPLREDGPAGLRRPWGPRVRGGQDGRAHGGQWAPTQRR